MDGSSTRHGAGVGVLLVNLEMDELEFAIKYHFKTLNNEADTRR